MAESGFCKLDRKAGSGKRIGEIAGAVLLLAVAVVATGCSGSSGANAKPVVTVLVAASLLECVEEIVEASGVRDSVQVDISAAASSSLARQIIAGARADLFLSASREWAEEIQKRIPESRIAIFTTNTLVLVAPKNDSRKVSSLQDFGGDEKLKLGVGEEEVPAGKYASQVLKKLKIWDELLARQQFVYGQDVRQVLKWTALGEVDGGLVYSSDALLGGEVDVVAAIDTSLHDRVEYWMVHLPGSDNSEEVADLSEFLLSETARGILERHGFGLVD